AAGLLFLLAVGNRWVLGPLVIDVPFPRWLVGILGVVRSNGRLCWPLACAILLLALWWLSRRLRPNALAAAVGIPAVLHVRALVPWHRSIRDWARREIPKWEVLDDPALTAWLQGRNAVILLPPGAVDQVAPFAWLAARHRMTINTARYARISPQRLYDAAVRD